jgi:hypothetical protein
MPVLSVAAAGTTQADAGKIPFTGFILATGAASGGGAGVVLPTPSGVGDWCVVKNTHASNAVKVYPAGSGKINDGSASAALSVDGTGAQMFFSPDGVSWYAVPVAAIDAGS